MKIKQGDIIRTDLTDELIIVNSIENTKEGIKINRIIWDDCDENDFEIVGIKNRTTKENEKHTSSRCNPGRKEL